MDGVDLGLAYFIVGTVVTLLVEVIRKALTKLDGRLVNLIAWGVGFGATYAPIPAFANLSDLEARLAAGLALAGVSSVIAEIKGVLTNSRKLKAAALEAKGAGNEAYGGGAPRFDEGYNVGEPGYKPV